MYFYKGCGSHVGTIGGRLRARHRHVSVRYTHDLVAIILTHDCSAAKRQIDRKFQVASYGVRGVKEFDRGKMKMEVAILFFSNSSSTGFILKGSPRGLQILHVNGKALILGGRVVFCHKLHTS